MLKVGVQYLAPPDMCQNVLDTESPDVARVKSDLTFDTQNLEALQCSASFREGETSHPGKIVCLYSCFMTASNTPSWREENMLFDCSDCRDSDRG